MLFHFKKQTVNRVPEGMEPVLLVSICTGETTACFRDKQTGKTTGICLIQNASDLEAFKSQYGITGDIPKIY